jgi:hypothetical protein
VREKGTISWWLVGNQSRIYTTSSCWKIYGPNSQHQLHTHAHAHKQERDDECWRAAIPLSDCWEWERNLKHSRPENERMRESLSSEKRGYTRFGREISPPRVSCLTRVCEANKTVELNRQKRRRSRAAAGNRDWFFLVHTPCVVCRLSTHAGQIQLQL